MLRTASRATAVSFSDDFVSMACDEASSTSQEAGQYFERKGWVGFSERCKLIQQNTNSFTHQKWSPSISDDFVSAYETQDMQYSTVQGIGIAGYTYFQSHNKNGVFATGNAFKTALQSNEGVIKSSSFNATVLCMPQKTNL